MATKKESGQVFTPPYLVCDILDVAGYSGSSIIGKYIIDNSCGDGAFLREIVGRYCTVFLKQSFDILLLKQHLSTYIHGIELDPEAYRQCICHLDEAAGKFGLSDIQWDVLNQDALSVSCYDSKMDFVVGNPPYVRVHHLADRYHDVKHFRFTQSGMTDLYLAFYEIGFQMLNTTGRLCYITPCSWTNSVAGNALRQYIRQHKNLVKLIDLAHFQPFEATTYTMIALFENGTKHDEFTYCTYIGEQHIILASECLSIEESMIGNSMYLADRKTLAILRCVFATTHKYVAVKNGFATLADTVFIRPTFPFSEHTIPVLKASTGKWYTAFYPYDTHGKPLSKEAIFAIPAIKRYLLDHQDLLLKGHSETDCPDWYLYGRTQALKDVWENKWAINSLIINKESIKLEKVAKGAGVYSGLYILGKTDEATLRRILISDAFVRYVRSLRHYKSGGYYTFSSKELEQYINCQLSQDEDQSNLFPAE